MNGEARLRKRASAWLKLSSKRRAGGITTVTLEADNDCGNQDGEWLRPMRAFASGTAAQDSASGLLTAYSANADEDAMVRLSTSVACCGKPHPAVLCEPPSIACVELPKMPDNAEVRVPQALANSGALSSTQVETVAYASLRFQTKLPMGTKAGYLLGDGTGCGKGRCIAALILDQWNRGCRRSVWISHSADLYADAARDLQDVHAAIPMCRLARVPPGAPLDTAVCPELDRLDAMRDGLIFLTYNMLIAGSGASTSPLRCPERSRFKQIVTWLRGRHPRGCGLIVFDEAHRAKNLKELVDAKIEGTKTGVFVEHLQRRCPGCPVLYASATSATEVKHLAYMSRLGLWGCEHPHFQSFQAFQRHIERGGVAAMEVLAVRMRAAGMFSCRSLSFEGVGFESVEVPLSPHAEAQYDAACGLWRDVLDAVRRASEDPKLDRYRQKAHRPPAGRLLWAAQQQFFKSLLVAAKVEEVACRVAAAVRAGEAVVVSMWSTHEARSLDKLKGLPNGAVLDALISGPEMILENFLDHHFPTRDPSGKLVSWAHTASQNFRSRLRALHLPPNPLDDLLDRLGGPSHVAEMTGRSHRIVADKDGQKRFVTRSADLVDAGPESINLCEQRSFQRGEKHIAIITEAASAGISLHSNKRLTQVGVAPRRRCMICLELPWAADKALQQFGRVHRSNQATPPRYELVVTGVPSEQRFISTIAHRLRLMGAVTRGDQRAPLEGGGFSQSDDLHGEYGKRAVDVLLKEVFQGESRRIDEFNMPMLRSRWGGQWARFAAAARRELEHVELGPECAHGRSAAGNAGGMQLVSRFLNRMLMIPVAMQSALFEAFLAIISSLRAQDQENGQLADQGLQSLTRLARARTVDKVSYEPLLPGGQFAFTLLRVDRGLSWEEVLARIRDPNVKPPEGLYMRTGTINSPCEPVLVLRQQGSSGDASKEYMLHWPYVSSSRLGGAAVSTKMLTNGRGLKFCPANSNDALENLGNLWRMKYSLSGDGCTCCDGAARNASQCVYCLRFSNKLLLTGDGLLSAWDVIEAALGDRTTMVRARTSCGASVVGVHVPHARASLLRRVLCAYGASGLHANVSSTARTKRGGFSLRCSGPRAKAPCNMVDVLDSSAEEANEAGIDVEVSDSGTDAGGEPGDAPPCAVERNMANSEEPAQMCRLGVGHSIIDVPIDVPSSDGEDAVSLLSVPCTASGQASHSGGLPARKRRKIESS